MTSLRKVNKGAVSSDNATSKFIPEFNTSDKPNGQISNCKRGEYNICA